MWSGRGRRWFRRANRRLEEMVGTRRWTALVFVVALADYSLQSLAVPLQAGRDFLTYAEYYDQLFNGVALPMLMLYRMPIAPLAIGSSLQFLGGAVTQVLMGLLFAVTITAWTATAARFGRRVAVWTAISLLVYPSFGIFFHRIASDQFFAVGFALWALLLVRAALEPSARRFAYVGAGITVLTLVRPGNQVLIVAALIPLVLAISWRRRVGLAVACAATVVATLAPWVVYNGVRFDDYTIARGANAFLPFYRAYVADHVISPDAGPASRELAAAAKKNLLDKEPYRSYGVTVDQFMRRGDTRMFEDVLNLSDRTWGWDSDYSKLRAVALEGIRKHPWPYVKGVAHTLDLEFRGVEVVFPVDLPDKSHKQKKRKRGPTETIVVNGRRLPAPTEHSVIPSARTSFASATPDGHIREVWTSPTEHEVAFDDPRDAARYAEMRRDIVTIGDRIPTYKPVDFCRRVYNFAARIFPRTTLWLVIGALALLIRRPWRWKTASLPAVLGLLVVVVNALAIYAILDFQMPVSPAFIMLGVVGLLGARAKPDAT